MPGAVLAALLFFAAAPAAAAEAAVAVEIPAGESKTVRLRKLPQGTALAVRIETSGRLLVALISAAALKSAPRTGALFRGAIDRRMTFEVVTPESGDYYLVLNNRNGSEALRVRAAIRARSPEGRPYSPRPEKASISPSASSI